MSELTREQMLQEGDNLELELEGKIFLIHKDKDGKLINREELNGEIMLKAFLNTLEVALNSYLPQETAEEDIKST
jgi:hypothetical protein